MSGGDETRDWLARAAKAAEALRGLRQRLLALHAELSSLRAASGADDAPVVRDAGVEKRAEGLLAREQAEPPAFVWPAGRTPN